MDELWRLGEASRPDRLSFWMDSAPPRARAAPAGPTETDVAIVGGGIAGLTAGLLLAEAGRDVLVLEADAIAAGVSGFTTAKLTAGHGLVYASLERRHGKDASRLYARSQLSGLEAVEEICERYAIACDLERAPNHVVATREEQLEQLVAEIAAARRAGLAPRRAGLDEIPFPAAGGLVLDRQLQLHPRRYLLGVAEALERTGGRIHEGTRVLEITGRGPFTLATDGGRVQARAVVVATHYPIVEQGFFATRIHPRRSYVVAALLIGDGRPGMFITAGTPTRSVRTAPLGDGRRLLVVGGEGHPVGRPADATDRYATLEGFMHQHFDTGPVVYRWSTQDLFGVDGLPYIGRVDGDGELYVATGFAGWGMSNGTVAGLLLTDAALERHNPYAALYDPARRSATASAKAFVAENTAIAPYQLGRRSRPHTHEAAARLAPGEGVVVDADGSEVAVARTSDGTLHRVSATCTHMGCTVVWNELESSWDCPCHGSRFAPDGRILHGPALRPLEAAPSRRDSVEATR